jgi:hypothetical protein
MLGPFSTWMGEHQNYKYAGCYYKVFSQLVASEGVGANTDRNYSAMHVCVNFCRSPLEKQVSAQRENCRS